MFSDGEVGLALNNNHRSRVIYSDNDDDDDILPGLEPLSSDDDSMCSDNGKDEMSMFESSCNTSTDTLSGGSSIHDRVELLPLSHRYESDDDTDYSANHCDFFSCPSEDSDWEDRVPDCKQQDSKIPQINISPRKELKSVRIRNTVQGNKSKSPSPPCEVLYNREAFKQSGLGSQENQPPSPQAGPSGLQSPPKKLLKTKGNRRTRIISTKSPKQSSPGGGSPTKNIPFSGEGFNVHLHGNELIEVGENVFGGDERWVVENIYSVNLGADYENRRIVDVLADLRRVFEEVIERMRRYNNHNDVARIFINTAEMYSPIIVGLMPLGQLTVNDIIIAIEEKLQSEEELKINSTLIIHAAVARIPRGKGRKLPLYSRKEMSRRYGMACVDEDDMLCLARSLNICNAYQEWKRLCSLPFQSDFVIKQARDMYHKMRNPTKHRDFRRHEAQRLMNRVGLNLNEPVGLNELHRFEALLGKKIVVLSLSHGKRVIYSGTIEDTSPIYLMMSEPARQNNTEGHFDALLQPQSVFSSNNWCHTCLHPFSSKKTHICKGHCVTCLRNNCALVPTESKRCDDCHRVCRSQACFEIHKRNRVSTQGKTDLPAMCDTYCQCVTCYKIMKKIHVLNHVCFSWKCNICEETCQGEHLCHIRPKRPNEPSGKYMDFDFEADPTNIHRATDVIAYWTCDECIDIDHKTNKICLYCGIPCELCQKDFTQKNIRRRKRRASDDSEKTKQCCGELTSCGLREKVFTGREVDKCFCEFVFTPQFYGYTLRAHNSQSYDIYFLMPYLIKYGFKPHNIYRGSHILYTAIKQGLNMRIIDSLCFFPLALSQFAKTFNLPTTKGHFPHWFNIEENENYIGNIPDKHYFGYNNMKVSDRVTFDLWYNEELNKNEPWNFKAEMEKYCRQDVLTLQRACRVFRQTIIKLSTKEVPDGVDENTLEHKTKKVFLDPFRYVTIASVCMALYRWKFLTETYDVTLKNGRGVKGLVTQEDMVVYLHDEDDTRGTRREDLTGDNMIAAQKFVSTPLAHIPNGGMATRDNYSRESIVWLKWYESERNKDLEGTGERIEIRHALQGGELKLRTKRGFLKPDGYYIEPLTGEKVCLMFEGCLWHGCLQCFPNDRENEDLMDDEVNENNETIKINRFSVRHPHTGESLSILYRKYEQRNMTLRNMGYKVISVWEHEWEELKKSNREVEEFCNNCIVDDRLNCRDGFFGGRVNATKLHYKVKEGEEIRYIDFTSLYPFINKTCRYPVSHPTVQTRGPFKEISEYFGMAYVEVLPPRGLYHPVLPFRWNNRLLFGLCSRCMKSGFQKKCRCSPDQRMMKGVWTTVELLKAEEKGYKIKRIIELYHWPETSKYDPTSSKVSIFSEYISLFMKMKQEASGYPRWCSQSPRNEWSKDDEGNPIRPKQTLDQKKYIDDYARHEGIQLEHDHIELNAGARMVAKLALNSHWGKYAQRLNMPLKKILSTPEEYINHISNPAYDIENFHILGKNALQVEYKHHPDFIPENGQTNIYIAVFTTAHARMKLYDVLDNLGRDIIYYDTDSAFYLWRKGQWEPPMGDYLGQLTNELDEGDHITEFVSSGPKSYAYETKKGKTVTRVKGFTLNYSASQLLNFETLRNLVMSTTLPDIHPIRSLYIHDKEIVGRGPGLGIPIHRESKIVRDRLGFKLSSVSETKWFSMVYTKRVIQKDGVETLPYGF
jgi:hypothetical protein